MKKSYLLVFVILGCVLFYRGGQMAWNWAAGKAQFTDEKRFHLPWGYELRYWPRDKGFLTVVGATLWIPGPGCYLALVGPNCFRDEAVIGCGAILLTSMALFVGWRRKSWKIALMGTCLAVAYGMYYKPWLALVKIRVGNQELFLRYYWQIVPWLWCIRCVAIAWVITMSLGVVSISIIAFSHSLRHGKKASA